LTERAETALRYLDPEEADHAKRSLRILETHDPANVSEKFPRLVAEESSKAIFLLRISPRLRALFSYPGDGTVVVEDLTSREVLSRHLQSVAS